MYKWKNEYRQQHIDSIIDHDAQIKSLSHYLSIGRCINDEHLAAKKRCEYAKNYYCKIKDTRSPKTDEQKAKEKEYHKNYYDKIKEKRVLESREV